MRSGRRHLAGDPPSTTPSPSTDSRFQARRPAPSPAQRRRRGGGPADPDQAAGVRPWSAWETLSVGLAGPGRAQLRRLFATSTTSARCRRPSPSNAPRREPVARRVPAPPRRWHAALASPAPQATLSLLTRNGRLLQRGRCLLLSGVSPALCRVRLTTIELGRRDRYASGEERDDRARDSRFRSETQETRSLLADGAAGLGRRAGGPETPSATSTRKD